jgi:hypothetical protein
MLQRQASSREEGQAEEEEEEEEGAGEQAEAGERAQDQPEAHGDEAEVDRAQPTAIQNPSPSLIEGKRAGWVGVVELGGGDSVGSGTTARRSAGPIQEALIVVVGSLSTIPWRCLLSALGGFCLAPGFVFRQVWRERWRHGGCREPWRIEDLTCYSYHIRGFYIRFDSFVVFLLHYLCIPTYIPPVVVVLLCYHHCCLRLTRRR